MKITVNYDSNLKVVDEDYAWSTTTYDLNDLDELEAGQLCVDINHDNLDVLGTVEEEADISRLLRAFLEREGDDVDRQADDIDFTGPGIYIVSGYGPLNEIYIARAQETFELELEDMEEDYKELFEIEE